MNQKSTGKLAQYSDSTNIGDALRNLREHLQCNQRDFAKLLGVSQGTIAHWESGRVKPPPMALMAIGKTDDENRDWWFELAGGHYARVDQAVKSYKETWQIDEDINRTILIFDSAGPGPNRFPPDKAIDKISLPRRWFAVNQTIVGLHAADDSMLPDIHRGDLVLVDIHECDDLPTLNGAMVGLRAEKGLRIKWLRKIGEAWMLFSQNSTEAPTIVQSRSDAIVGRVVMWMCKPILKK